MERRATAALAGRRRVVGAAKPRYTRPSTRGTGPLMKVVEIVPRERTRLYGVLVASLFSAFGIWLGLRITKGRETVRETVVVREVAGPVAAASGAVEPFAPNTAQQQSLGITARELEILRLVARGLSNREIAEQLFVSENTVKTHCSRTFDKLGAARRTQAVQRGKELGLLP